MAANNSSKANQTAVADPKVELRLERIEHELTLHSEVLREIHHDIAELLRLSSRQKGGGCSSRTRPEDGSCGALHTDRPVAKDGLARSPRNSSSSRNGALRQSVHESSSLRHVKTVVKKSGMTKARKICLVKRPLHDPDADNSMMMINRVFSAGQRDNTTQKRLIIEPLDVFDEGALTERKSEKREATSRSALGKFVQSESKSRLAAFGPRAGLAASCIPVKIKQHSRPGQKSGLRSLAGNCLALIAEFSGARFPLSLFGCKKVMFRYTTHRLRVLLDRTAELESDRAEAVCLRHDSIGGRSRGSRIGWSAGRFSSRGRRGRDTAVWRGRIGKGFVDR